MEWVTIYDISVHQFIFPQMLIAMLCIHGGVFLVCSVPGMTNSGIKENIRLILINIICVLCLSAVVVVIANVGAAFLRINSMVYEEAYKTGNYEIIEGMPHSQHMANGGFFFSVGDLNFICEKDFSPERSTHIDKYIKDDNVKIKVFYYGDEMYDTVNQEYMILRIDVLMEQEANL